MVKRVFLVGYMGSGKSTIGRYVAKDMGWRFVDADDYFEKKAGMTIKEYFRQHGEEAFRQAERDVLAELCREENVIVATGGGAPCFFDNMERMRQAGLTIYIDVQPEELCARLARAKAKRPIIADKSDDELLEFVSAQLAKREPFYRNAEMVVDGKALPFSAYKMFIMSFSNMD